LTEFGHLRSVTLGMRFRTLTDFTTTVVVDFALRCCETLKNNIYCFRKQNWKHFPGIALLKLPRYLPPGPVSTQN